MNKVYGQLIKVFNNPYIYIGAPSLEALRHFMAGYSLRDDEEKDNNSDWYNNLLLYVYKYFGVNYSATSKDWVDVLKENSENEEDAFFKFFTVLESFVHQFQKD